MTAASSRGLRLGLMDAAPMIVDEQDTVFVLRPSDFGDMPVMRQPDVADMPLTWKLAKALTASGAGRPATAQLLHWRGRPGQLNAQMRAVYQLDRLPAVFGQVPGQGGAEAAFVGQRPYVMQRTPGVAPEGAHIWFAQHESDLFADAARDLRLLSMLPVSSGQRNALAIEPTALSKNIRQVRALEVELGDFVCTPPLDSPTSVGEEIDALNDDQVLVMSAALSCLMYTGSDGRHSDVTRAADMLHTAQLMTNQSMIQPTFVWREGDVWQCAAPHYRNQDWRGFPQHATTGIGEFWMQYAGTEQPARTYGEVTEAAGRVLSMRSRSHVLRSHNAAEQLSVTPLTVQTATYLVRAFREAVGRCMAVKQTRPTTAYANCTGVVETAAIAAPAKTMLAEHARIAPKKIAQYMVEALRAFRDLVGATKSGTEARRIQRTLHVLADTVEHMTSVQYTRLFSSIVDASRYQLMTITPAQVDVLSGAGALVPLAARTGAVSEWQVSRQPVPSGIFGSAPAFERFMSAVGQLVGVQATWTEKTHQLMRKLTAYTIFAAGGLHGRMQDRYENRELDVVLQAMELDLMAGAPSARAGGLAQTLVDKVNKPAGRAHPQTHAGPQTVQDGTYRRQRVVPRANATTADAPGHILWATDANNRMRVTANFGGLAKLHRRAHDCAAARRVQHGQNSRSWLSWATLYTPLQTPAAAQAAYPRFLEYAKHMSTPLELALWPLAAYPQDDTVITGQYKIAPEDFAAVCAYADIAADGPAADPDLVTQLQVSVSLQKPLKASTYVGATMEKVSLYDPGRVPLFGLAPIRQAEVCCHARTYHNAACILFFAPEGDNFFAPHIPDGGDEPRMSWFIPPESHKHEQPPNPTTGLASVTNYVRQHVETSGHMLGVFMMPQSPYEVSEQSALLTTVYDNLVVSLLSWLPVLDQERHFMPLSWTLDASGRRISPIAPSTSKTVRYEVSNPAERRPQQGSDLYPRHADSQEHEQLVWRVSQLVYAPLTYSLKTAVHPLLTLQTLQDINPKPQLSCPKALAHLPNSAPRAQTQARAQTQRLLQGKTQLHRLLTSKFSQVVRVDRMPSLALAKCTGAACTAAAGRGRGGLVRSARAERGVTMSEALAPLSSLLPYVEDGFDTTARLSAAEGLSEAMEYRSAQQTLALSQGKVATKKACGGLAWHLCAQVPMAFSMVPQRTQLLTTIESTSRDPVLHPFDVAAPWAIALTHTQVQWLQLQRRLVGLALRAFPEAITLDPEAPIDARVRMPARHWLSALVRAFISTPALLDVHSTPSLSTGQYYGNMRRLLMCTEPSVVLQALLDTTYGGVPAEELVMRILYTFAQVGRYDQHPEGASIPHGRLRSAIAGLYPLSLCGDTNRHAADATSPSMASDFIDGLATLCAPK